MDDDDPQRKHRLRTRQRAKLRELTAEAAHVAGRRVALRLSHWREFGSVGEVAAFSSIAGEIAMGPSIEAARAHGHAILLPRMRGDSLEFVPISEPSGGPLVAGRFGVLEPEPGLPERALKDGALVLVPGLAFDLGGGRLGRGAGYYDRALAEVRRQSDGVLFLGVGFALQMVDQVPMSSLDVRLDGVLTEAALAWVD